MYMEPTHSHMHSGEDFSSFSGITQDDINDTVSELIYEEFKKKQEEERNKLQIRFIPRSLEEMIQNSYLPIVPI